MVELKCTNCGGKILVEDGAALYTCDSCGATFEVPTLDDEALDKIGNTVADTVGQSEARIIEAISGIQSTAAVGTVDFAEAMTAAEEKRYEQKIVNLLKNAWYALEDEKFSEAGNLYKEILKEVPQCAEAYMGIFMAKHKATRLLADKTDNKSSSSTYVSRFIDSWNRQSIEIREKYSPQHAVNVFDLTKASLLELCGNAPNAKQIPFYLNSFQDLTQINLQHAYLSKESVNSAGLRASKAYFPIPQDDRDFARAMEFASPEQRAQYAQLPQRLDELITYNMQKHKKTDQELHEKVITSARETIIASAAEYSQKVKKALTKNILVSLAVSILFLGNMAVYFVALPIIFFLLLRKNEYGVKQGLKTPGLIVTAVSVAGLAAYLIANVGNTDFTANLSESLMIYIPFLLMAGVAAYLLKMAKQKAISAKNSMQETFKKLQNLQK